MDSISIKGKDTGILSFLFPDMQIYREDDILLKNKTFKKENYQIVRNNGIKVDTKEGILQFLKEDRKLKISKNFERYLEEIDEEEFWKTIKLFTLTKETPKTATDDFPYLFDIFKCMFQDFRSSYRSYRKLSLPHPIVFSSLMTMMLKTPKAKNLSVSESYRKVLLDNFQYFDRYKRQVLGYFESDQKEIDFVSFLYKLSMREV